MQSATSPVDTADPYRVLIVEDDRSQALFAEAILRGAGMRPEVIAQPEQVMAAMERFDPDLVLMDLHLPGISGTVLTTRIREHPRFEQVPVVFLTGDQDPERQLEVLELGADDYILKPVRPRHLIAAVQSRVRRARAAASRTVVAAEPERHPVTGLFTRPALMQKLAASLPDGRGGVLLVEIGNAAALRNRFGYAGFESLMNEAGRHLGSVTDPHPAARLSDNAFLVLAPDGEARALAALARGVRDGIGYRDFRADDETLRLRATVGHASLAHAFADTGAVLAAAEDAARDARTDPVGVAAYVPPATPEEGGGVLADLRAALAGDGLQLAFQPVVAVAGGDQASSRSCSGCATAPARNAWPANSCRWRKARACCRRSIAGCWSRRWACCSGGVRRAGRCACSSRRRHGPLPRMGTPRSSRACCRPAASTAPRW